MKDASILTGFPNGLTAGFNRLKDNIFARFKVACPYYEVLGQPIAIDLTYFLSGCTSTLAPNANTKTYTLASAITNSLVGASGTVGTGYTAWNNYVLWTTSIAYKKMAIVYNQTTGLVYECMIAHTSGTFTTDLAAGKWAVTDKNRYVPRNCVVTVTHSSAVVASTVVVTGTDRHGQVMSELFTITAGTTSKTATGKKAFASITSIALTAAGDATTNTFNVGMGDTLGLSKLMAYSTIFLQTTTGAIAATGTITVADVTTPATTSTGDVRGTVLPAVATDGAKLFAVAYIPSSLSSSGVTQV